MLRRFIAAGVVLAVLSMVLAGTALAQTGNAATGKTVWGQKNCKSCHGDNGEGRFAGPRAGDGLTVAQWVNQVRNPRAQMPAFRDTQVSDQEIADMNAYMQTLPKPASFTPAASIAKEGDPAGKMLFAQKRCQACHGDGSGLVQNRFTNQNRTVDAAAVIKQLRTPAQNMPMFRANQVSDEEATQIATYLRSLQQAAPAAQPAAPAPAAPAAPAAQPAPPAPGALPRTGGEPGGILPVALVLAGLSVVLFGLGTGLRARSRTR